MSTIPEDLLAEMSEAFSSDEVDKFSRLMAFMASEDGQNYVQVLKTSLAKGKEFLRSTARLLAEDIGKTKSDPWYRNMLYNLWENYLQPNKTGPEHEINFERALVATAESQHAAEFTMLRLLSKMPQESAAQLVKHASEVAFLVSKEIGFYVDAHGSSAIQKLAKFGGKIAPVALVIAFVTYEGLLSLYQWWTGKITGKRCVKLIVDSGAALVGGLATGAMGAAVGGMLAGPAGGVIAGIAGALAGCEISKRLSDYLTRNIFDIPKDIALENAYTFLDVKHSNSNDAINKQFRKLCLQYHPDKGGKIEEWHRLQLSMTVIRFARGETP